MEKLQEVPVDIRVWPLIIIFAAILIMGFWLLIRLARELLKRRVLIIPAGQYRKKVERPHLFWLPGVIKKAWYKLKFLMLWRRRLYTPEGTFLVIEKMGRHKGFPRAIDETPSSYLKRLYVSIKGKASQDVGEIRALTHILVQELDRSFYGGKSGFSKGPAVLGKKELKTLIRYFFV